MYDRTRTLIESEKSKFIFTGQHSKNPNTKLYHFAFVSLGFYPSFTDGLKAM